MLTTETGSAPSPFTRRFRLLSVYGVVLRILLSYGVFKVAGWFLGSDWSSRRSGRLHRKNARRVERLILRLQGLFIKIGQLISILTNFLPEDFRTGLEGLQDQIPARPITDIEERLRAELGNDPAALFDSFDPNPLASASLAQVHRARLHDGREVAVKVQHIDIETTARLDLKTIRRVFGFLGLIFRIKGLQTQYDQLYNMIMEELDFSLEADHIEHIASHFTGVAGVALPEVIREYSSKRVLTTGFIDGVKVTNIRALEESGIDRKLLAERIVEAYCQMIFVDGVYHADPHPGNILVMPDGTIVFIDFGAVARLSPAMKEGIPQLLLGILRRNPEQILRAVNQIGFVAHADSEKSVEQLVDLFYDRFLENLSLDTWNIGEISADSTMDMKMEMWADMRRMNLSIRELMNAFQVPKDWILLDRTVLLLLGLCTHLDPEMNPMTTIGPYLEKTVLGPEGDWKSFLTAAVKDVAQSAISIPAEMNRLLVRVNRGELEVNIKGLEKSTRLIYALGHQFLFGMIGLGSGILAYMARANQDESMFTVTAVVSVGAFFIALVSMVRARKWTR